MAPWSCPLLWAYVWRFAWSLLLHTTQCSGRVEIANVKCKMPTMNFNLVIKGLLKVQFWKTCCSAMLGPWCHIASTSWSYNNFLSDRTLLNFKCLTSMTIPIASMMSGWVIRELFASHAQSLNSAPPLLFKIGGSMGATVGCITCEHITVPCATLHNTIFMHPPTIINSPPLVCWMSHWSWRK